MFVEIIPAILIDREVRANEQIEILKATVEWAHLDVIDGVFADMETVKPSVITDSGIDWEVHLLVEEPVIWIQRCLEAKAERLIAQVENMSDQNEFVETVLRAGVDVGLAVDLDTPVQKIDEGVLPWLNKVLILGVKAGRSGQSFNESVYEKVKSLIL